MGVVKRRESEQVHQPESLWSEERPQARSPLRVLVVEDDSGLREAMSILLVDEGYRVETATDGLSALNLLRRSRDVGVIILDVRMPVMNGWEFRLAQRADAALASIPVIAVSADGSPQAMAIDADLHFQKPIDTPQFLAGVQRLLWQYEREGMQARLDEAERLALLGRVVAGVGHELNNPLAYLSLNVEAVRESLLKLAQDARSDKAGFEPLHQQGTRFETLLGRVADCETGLERIRQVASNLRSLSRQNESADAHLALNEILDGARAMVRSQVEQRATLVCAYDRLPSVFGHAGRLGQVFVNLLANAAQAIPEGQQDQHRITVRGSSTATHAVIEIEDTGQGIPSDVLPHVFEPFFTTREDPQGGTGLGLSVSRQIVIAHGGELTIESRVGIGTIARVSLPISAASAGAHADAKVAEQPSHSPRRGRVLVLDDDPLVARALTNLLKREHEVVERHRATEALDLLREGQRFDVILCDVLMPDMDGAAFFEALSRGLPELTETVVFMTGGAFTPRTTAFVENLKTPVIAKPFDAAKLRALVRTRVDGPGLSSGASHAAAAPLA